jgi:hypothetical protein
MPKQVTFRLNATLKCGSTVYLKGAIFDEKHMPDELMQEVNSGSNTIEVMSFGDDFSGSEFDPEKSITTKEPSKKLAPKKRKVKV